MPNLKPDQYFEASTRSIFRFEGLPRYTVQEEASAIAAFKAVKTEGITPLHQDWYDFVREKSEAGVAVSRIRAVTCPTMTDYETWETKWAYPFNTAAGENIKLIDRAQAYKCFKGLAPKDFWIFDDRWAAWVNYDHNGSFLGLEEATSLLDDLIGIWESLNQLEEVLI